MHSLIVIGGMGPSDLIGLSDRRYDRIIAADSGYDLAVSLGLKVDTVVGDLDSSSYSAVLRDSGMHVSSRDKDESDFELALAETNGGSYDLLGGGEGRLDHTMSIFSSFIKFSPPEIWVTRADFMVLLRKASFEAPEGMQISLFPALVGREARVSTHGLVWDLDGGILGPAFISLSNRTKGGHVDIDSDGLLFARFEKEKLAFSVPDANIQLC